MPRITTWQVRNSYFLLPLCSLYRKNIIRRICMGFDHGNPRTAPCKLSSRYEKGIAGIGVGINYLSYNNLIEIEEDLFEDFDKRMYRAVIHDPFPNYSRDEGLIGYGWYWLHRAKSQMSNECLSFITESIKNNRNDLSANEQQDIYLFLRAHTRELESNRIFPKLKPSLTFGEYGVIWWLCR